MLNRGEIGCMVLNSSYIKEIQNAGSNMEDIQFMPFPITIDGIQYATARADSCYAIHKNSEHKELAQKWIDYMEKKSGYAISEVRFSILKNAALSGVLSHFEHVQRIVEQDAAEVNKGKFETLDKESDFSLFADIGKRQIVDAAIGNTEETFKEIMKDWNQKWKKAMDRDE